MRRYNPKEIEPKWQKIWDEQKTYEVTEDTSKQKVYATPMLPYPSGAGLHTGHVRNYSITDAVARFHRQRGMNTMSNMAWDAFGLPAENYAIKTGTPPAESTAKNIAYFKKQLKRTGMSYDWSREFNTSDPSYYKWTQWVFTKLFEHGLAYQAEKAQWWCDQCKTVLADEQVVAGKCWRHDGAEDPMVTKKSFKQWFFKITAYADELLDSTDALDWPEKIKTMQKNWIGRKEGINITYDVSNCDGKETLTVFTTRPDTNYGATFLVLAPEHEFVQKIINQEITPSEGPSHHEAVQHYVKKVINKSELERKEEGRLKTGVFTGFYITNPLNDEKLPVWVSDFVLAGFGTGAVVGVPGHDLRDYQFAKQFDIPVKRVVIGNDGDNSDITSEDQVQEENGKMVNSGPLDGLDIHEATKKMMDLMEENGMGGKTVSYSIRDWLISRQRYWGAPIPIIHCPDDGPVAVPEKDLPVVLPEVKDFAPDGSHHSVLAREKDWVNTTCPKCGKPAQRETDTMDGYACSSWYMYRYTDAHNDQKAWDPEKVNYWFPVDYYFGGDHAVSHLLYFRFWHKFFCDIGLIGEKVGREPVKRLIFNGYINAEDGSKMSKSKGNTVDPMDIIESGYGADALRVFELFIAPYDQDTSWNTNGVPGAHRFLSRVWTLAQEFMEAGEGKTENEELLRPVHKMIAKVTEDMESLSFNTAVAAMMTCVNELYAIKAKDAYKSAGWRFALESLAQLLGPFAPHIAEELWQELGHKDTVHKGHWPEFDKKYLVEDMMTIAIQVNGKLRATIEVSSDSSEEVVIKTAKADEKIKAHLDGEPKKTIYVPKKLVNFVV